MIYQDCERRNYYLTRLQKTFEAYRLWCLSCGGKTRAVGLSFTIGMVKYKWPEIECCKPAIHTQQPPKLSRHRLTMSFTLPKRELRPNSLYDNYMPIQKSN